MKVYIVDDDAITLVIIANMLVERGFTPAYSHSTDPDLITRMEEFEPDLIMVDIYMPVIDGYGVRNMIKRNPLLWDIPVLAISSTPEYKDKENVFDGEFVDFIQKPIDKERFIRKVRRFCFLGMMSRNTRPHNRGCVHGYNND